MFGKDRTVVHYVKGIREIEELLGRKEGEIRPAAAGEQERLGPRPGLGGCRAASDVADGLQSELRRKNGRKKAHFMPVLDPRVKWVPDWRWGDGGTGLEAMGLSLEGRIAHHDQDPVYTGHRRLCRLLVKGKARVSYSEHGAKGTR